jgi:hypothetical protein
MTQKQFNQYAGVVFLLAGGLHAYRLLGGHDLYIGDWLAPVWLSGVAVAVTLYLAYYGLKKL